MACNELAALRLGLMNVLAIDDQHEKEHEEKDLGVNLTTAGPLQSLATAGDLDKLKRFYSVTLVELQERVAQMTADDPKLAYYQSLVLVTKKVEQEISVYYDNFYKLYNDLDEIHHMIHEVFPTT